MSFVCYRIVKSADPAISEFMSQAELGKKPPPHLPKDVVADWDGISLLETFDQAVAWQQRKKYLGSFIAELILPDWLAPYRKSADRFGHFVIKVSAADIFPHRGKVTSV